ncbi:MAG: winged helix-turn-helix transcriptional regulator [Novosphingobium sp.]
MRDSEAKAVLDRPELQALAAEMRRHGTTRDAPVREVMGLLGDRWTTLILLVLATGQCRHSALRRALGHLSDEQAISQRVLTLKLRALERDGFVLRHASADVPPKVGYELTELGRALHAQAAALIGWIEANSPAITKARDQFAAREDQDLPRTR